jgi:membrane protein YqaA with SNARE-associated domain
MKNYKETQKKYYQKNKLKIKQKRQRQQERDELEQKFYKYGFWLLLTAGVVNLILTKI